MNRFFKLDRRILVLVLLLVSLPFWVGNPYQLHIATLIGTYWVLICALNLTVGYTGILSIGHVALLSIGAYSYAILSGTYDLSPWIATVCAGALGGLCGLLLGLPSLRLPGFYFAMATIAFSMMTMEFSLAQDELTGGGAGLSVPSFPAPFDSPEGLYWLVLAFAAVVTFLSWNLVRFMWGRALIAVRDSHIAASAVGVPIFRAKLSIFTFSGVAAGVAGALFSSLQSYITPETFVFELSMFFFVCIVIGGRGSMWGPFIGTVVLAALPELAGSLAHWGQFFYGVLLLAVVLLIPEGVGSAVTLIKEKYRPTKREKHVVSPDLDRLRAAISLQPGGTGRGSSDHPGGARLTPLKQSES